MIKYMGKMVRCSLRDRDCKPPFDPPETLDTQFCSCYLTDIDFCHWAGHITSKFHKVSQIVNTWLKCFCWFKNSAIPWHHWGLVKNA